MIKYNNDGSIEWDQGTVGAFAPIIRNAAGDIISVDNTWTARMTIHPAIGKPFIQAIDGVITSATIGTTTTNVFTFNIAQNDLRNVKFAIGELQANLYYQLDIAQNGITLSSTKNSFIVYRDLNGV